MAHLNYPSYEGFGETARDSTHYSQTVKIGNTIEISGQGGWDRITEKIPDDIGAQVDQAFSNVEYAVKQAGGTGWDQIYKLRCYTVPLDENIAKHIIRNLRKYFPNHQPLLTVVGVQNLAFGMAIEIEAVANLDGI
ncbi:hypothetical protein PAAG_07323 [Paracoccidioides lutzii Pb01]|uniref:Uncharacterized protein n=1 Tax=Paracoccidioides lutzii (strain ATCC MYA-826 / Pb01) TaxID=502779 RepID=C1H982_PARBA|nr:hypothetical protein PAAG_07323 [Paracoccidioides lutzii Pb01]EEH36905.1 hypothetical protein PAAG_07323 [Paracoccidioides lutzii Pb01]